MQLPPDGTRAQENRKRGTLTSSPATAYQASISQLLSTIAALWRRCRSSHISLLRAPRASSPVKRASPFAFRPSLDTTAELPPLLPFPAPMIALPEAGLPPLLLEADEEVPRGGKPEEAPEEVARPPLFGAEAACGNGWFVAAGC